MGIRSPVSRIYSGEHWRCCALAFDCTIAVSKKRASGTKENFESMKTINLITELSAESLVLAETEPIKDALGFFFGQSI